MRRAPLFARLLAFLIDVVFLLCVSLGLFAAGLLGSVTGASAVGAASPGFFSSPSAFMGLFFFFEAFLFLFYFTYLTSHGEQTLGKAAFGLTVVQRREGVPIGFFRSLGRAFAYWASALPLFLGFSMAFLLGGRTLHDMLAGTMVVKEE
jgi:uncharacterized RDD family membrane protein YckC